MSITRVEFRCRLCRDNRSSAGWIRGSRVFFPSFAGCRRSWSSISKSSGLSLYSRQKLKSEMCYKLVELDDMQSDSLFRQSVLLHLVDIDLQGLLVLAHPT